MDAGFRVRHGLLTLAAGAAGYLAVRLPSTVADMLPWHLHLGGAISQYWPLAFAALFGVFIVFLVAGAWAALLFDYFLSHRRHGFSPHELSEIERDVAAARCRARLPV